MKRHSLEVKKWRDKNPLKMTAHWKVNYAIRHGKITKQPCNECGAEKAQAHHEDYSKPLDITWLCSRCHSNKHNPNKKTIVRQKLISINGRLRRPTSSFILHKSKIAELRKDGLSYSQISKDLNLSQGTVYKIHNNPKYK